MKLDNIGFSEVTDDRVAKADINSNINYCEFIITSKCNFNCPYCNKFKGKLAQDLSLTEIKSTIELLEQHNLKYLHITGGEPTVRKDILNIIDYAHSKNMRIGISTNGSADLELYKQMIANGVKLFSISLDTNCDEFNKRFTGVENIWTKVVNNIRELTKLTYVNVGTVLMQANIANANEIIKFISDLGVSDIKIGTATQYNKMIKLSIDKEILDKHPILKYRVNNFNNSRNMRGLTEHNCNKCFMALDDISIVGKYHFPCAVYAREGGTPIGIIGAQMESERLTWLRNHNSHTDKICQEFCMDFKCDFNDKFYTINKNIAKILK